MCLILAFAAPAVFPQRLAEAAEDADLYHEYNDTLEVCVVCVSVFPARIHSMSDILMDGQ